MGHGLDELKIVPHRVGTILGHFATLVQKKNRVYQYPQMGVLDIGDGFWEYPHLGVFDTESVKGEFLKLR